MVRNYNDNFQVSDHFCSSEFKCKCGCGQIKIDDRLITMLETVFSKCNAKYIKITSGYRCPTYDRKIGGFVGKHAEGRAADIKVMGQDDKWVSTKIISCIMQDEFAKEGAGIANINSDYSAIHIDSRLGSCYRGNELLSNNSVTTDFHYYYGLSSTDIDKLIIKPKEVIECEEKWAQKTNPLIKYRAMVNGKLGSWKYENEVCGNPSSNEYIERFKIQSNGLDDAAKFSYRVRISNYGLGKTKTNGNLVGKVGEKIERINIKCDRKIRYRVFQDNAWSKWYKNGKWAGQKNKYVKAIQIKFYTKD